MSTLYAVCGENPNGSIKPGTEENQNQIDNLSSLSIGTAHLICTSAEVPQWNGEFGNGLAATQGRSRHYPVCNASRGEIKPARKAGTVDAISAESPTARTAVSISTRLYGLMP